MKRIALIISFVALFSLQGFTQLNKYSYGIKLGPTFNWASSSSTTSSNEGMRVGFSFGIIGERNLNSFFTLSTGINAYFWNGHYQFEDTRTVGNFLQETLVTVNRRVRSTYVEIPLKGKVKISVMDGLKAFAETGVGLGINAKTKTKDEYKYQWETYADNTFISDNSKSDRQYRLFQASLLFGLGAQYEINSKFSVFAQVSYSHGLTNSFRASLEKETGANLKTNMISLEIGIMH